MKLLSARHFAPLLSILLLAACDHIPGGISEKAESAPANAKVSADDVVVIAVLDDSMNPYHWDYLASKMPDSDLPLDQDPSTWLPGFPGASAFKSFGAITLNFDDSNPDASTTALHDADAAEWGKIVNSEGNSNADVNYYWFPGTKIVGHVAFAGSGPIDPWAASSHGIGTSSVSAGNIHGTCPHCVLVYVHGAPEIAEQWVSQQDWIDLQTNSYGDSFNSAVTCIPPVDVACGLVRDLVYAGTDTELQRQTVERGQSIFFSGGNGIINDFSVPHINLVSSQKGPDWIITVGAVVSEGDNAPYTGAGKPVDIASLGDGYPSAYGDADNTTNEGPFSGSSNATPVVAGLYGEALYQLRKQMGSKRMQRDGVISEGKAGCGAANANCALADGQLTVHELREALFRSAQYTGAGVYIGDVGLPVPFSTREIQLLSEGHGTLLGKFPGEENYQAELARIVGFANGSWYEEQDPEQRDWMTADSLCRQGGWGEWQFGYAPLNSAPAPSPDWPVRTWMATVCPSALGAVITLEKTLGIDGTLPLPAALAYQPVAAE